jgi:hypothetical protein
MRVSVACDGQVSDNPKQLQSRASGSLRLILAREWPGLRLVHVHFPKAGFELSEP